MMRLDSATMMMKSSNHLLPYDEDYPNLHRNANEDTARFRHHDDEGQ